MTKILNLFPTSSHLPFRWYPLTEAYRRFLREKAIGTGVCIKYPAAGRHIYLEQGVNRNYMIDNFLVSGVDVYQGKLFCVVEFDNIIIMCSREVRQLVYDAIQAAPQIRRAPFITNNKFFEFFKNDLVDDLEKMSQNIQEIGYDSALDQLSVLKLLALRFEQKDHAKEFFTNLSMSFLPDCEFDQTAEMIKIAKHIFNDETAAIKLLNHIKNSVEYGNRQIEVEVMERYIFNKVIDTRHLLRMCDHDIDFENIFLNNIINLCMYFDFALAHKILDKAELIGGDVDSALNIAILTEYLLDRKEEANETFAAAKNDVICFEEAIAFLRYVVKTGKAREDFDKLIAKYPRTNGVINSITLDYLKSLKYGLEDFEEYNRVKSSILNEATSTILLLNITKGLYRFDAAFEDIDEYYQRAKKLAAGAQDYIALASWCLEVDKSKKPEVTGYLQMASEKCSNANEHLDVALLLIRNDFHEKAKPHLQVAYDYATDTNTLMQIADSWLMFDREDEAKKALLKAEKVARLPSDFDEIANAWEEWMEDNNAAKRCRKKSSSFYKSFN